MAGGKFMTKSKKRGFTIIELLVVISIIATLATLATGAAVKAIGNARSKRIDAMVKSLELALMNYRALHGDWPYTFDKPESMGATTQSVRGKDNANVFKKIFDDIQSNRSLLDTSALFTRIPGSGRMTVQKALEQGKTPIPVGYPNPKNSSEFIYFTVTFNFLTDMVTVSRDQNAENDNKITTQ